MAIAQAAAPHKATNDAMILSLNVKLDYDPQPFMAQCSHRRYMVCEPRLRLSN